MNMDENTFKQMESEGGNYHYPTHYEIVPYTIKPDLSEKNYFIRPKVKGDKPVLMGNTGDDRKGDMSVQVIAGTDGPTSVFLCHKSVPGGRKVVSPLYFKPTEVRDYEIVFRVKPAEDISLNLEP